MLTDWEFVFSSIEIHLNNNDEISFMIRIQLKIILLHFKMILIQLEFEAINFPGFYLNPFQLWQTNARFLFETKNPIYLRFRHLIMCFQYKSGV